MMTSFFKIISICIIGIGIIISIVFWIFLCDHNIILTPKGETPDMPLTGNIGDFVGGTIGTIFASASALLIIVTLHEQDKQNSRDKFAQSFYEMLHLHRENVSELSFKKRENDILRGRSVFAELIREYTQVYKLIDSYCNNIKSRSRSENVKNYLGKEEKRYKFEMELSYGYFYYGSEDYELDNLNEEELIIQSKIKRLLNYNNFVISSHNVLLGHYYRHLYQMVKMLEDERNLSESEKYAYAKQLRAQLNDNEQLLLYYNAMSRFGREWIKPPTLYRKKIQHCFLKRWSGFIKFSYPCFKKTTFKRKTKEMCSLARFRMIKNIPSNMEILGILPEQKFKNEIKIYQSFNKFFFENRKM